MCYLFGGFLVGGYGEGLVFFNMKIVKVVSVMGKYIVCVSVYH